MIYDISMPLGPDTPAYPGDPPFERELVQSLARGDPATVSCLRMSAHNGTHVDAPAHLLPDGPPLDSFLLEAMCGPATVVAVPGVPRIDAADLARTGRL